MYGSFAIIPEGVVFDLYVILGPRVLGLGLGYSHSIFIIPTQCLFRVTKYTIFI
jgi:hypothetical protein